jgi:hypothetical protein
MRKSIKGQVTKDQERGEGDHFAEHTVKERGVNLPDRRPNASGA